MGLEQEDLVNSDEAALVQESRRSGQAVKPPNWEDTHIAG